MALPMTLIIIAGEIDLSIAVHPWPLSSSLARLPMGPRLAHAADHRSSSWSSGVACGVVNGFLVTRLGLPSLAVTIGTMTLYAGIAEIILGSTSISNFPAGYTTIGVNPFPHTDLSYSAVIFISAGNRLRGRVALHPLWARSSSPSGGTKRPPLRRHPGQAGQDLAVHGLGPHRGTGRHLLTFRLSTAESDNGTGLVLSVVAVVLLGGVSIFGGKGSMFGVILAVLVFCGLQNALLLTNFPECQRDRHRRAPPGRVLVPNTGELLRRWSPRWRPVVLAYAALGKKEVKRAVPAQFSLSQVTSQN